MSLYLRVCVVSNISDSVYGVGIGAIMNN